MSSFVASQESTIHAGLQALFATGTFNVTFIKADGTLRTLKVTLHPEVLAENGFGETKKTSTRTVNEANATVFDVDAKAWKSFAIASLVSISVVFQ
jgi:hypothetical protein